MANAFKVAIDNTNLIIEAERAQINKALKSVGMTAEKYAKERCPVDTGNLRNSITNTTDLDTAYVGTNVEYAAYVEMGTSKMGKRPYIQPAVEEHLDEYKNMIETILKG